MEVERDGGTSSGLCESTRNGRAASYVQDCCRIVGKKLASINGNHAEVTGSKIIDENLKNSNA